MRIKRIADGAVVRLASRGFQSEPLRVGDEVSNTDALHVENAPPWPEHAVEYEDDGSRLGAGRIGGMVIE